MADKLLTKLHFLKLIQDAFDSNDARESLRQAMAELKAKRDDPDYRETYGGFIGFLDAVAEAVSSDQNLRDTIREQLDSEALIEILLSDFTGDDAEREKILSQAKEAAGFEALRDEIESFLEKQPDLELEVWKDNVLIAQAVCDSAHMPVEISDFSPADIVVKLSNGRVLWSGGITENEVRWKTAFPGKEYPAAAMTEPTKVPASISELLLGGSLRFEVFPGIESATLRLSLTETDKK